MSAGEFAGYVASILVFITFYMKTMVPLRIVGICSNVAFITYALLDGLVPILILHSALLPLNFFRLHQILKLGREAREAARGELSVEALLPFMTRRWVKAGEVLFRKGEPSNEMFYIRSGVIRLPEVDKMIGDGEIIGEISMFSPSKQRTTTALCETDGELLRLSDGDVIRLYYQNPRFGFHVVRLITRRLIENYAAVETAMSGPVSLEARPREAASANPSPGRPPPTGSGSASSARSSRRRRSRTVLHLLGWSSAAVVPLGSGAWFLAPYVKSVLFRDAAITTWINVATTPIRGNLDGPLPQPGQRVGADGRLTVVHNPLVDPSEVDKAAAEVARAEAEVSDLEVYLSSIRKLDEQWRNRTATYAATFKKNLELEIEGTKRELDFIAQRLALEAAVADRQRDLASRGNSPQSAADESEAAVMELERQRAENEQLLARAEQRERAVDQGVYLLSDGRNRNGPIRATIGCASRSRRRNVRWPRPRPGLVKARVSAETARKAFALIRASPVVAPPGSLVWSTIAGTGAAVNIGTPVAQWIDCSVMLVDVPAYDAEIGLLHPGMAADVVIEGEQALRHGTVLLTRGGASTLGDTDLAATAKGRKPGLGQVIVSLKPSPKDVDKCPIGAAAWVDFPQIDVIDLLRARLRL
jgi:CRP-like cAMP-binding protein